MPDDRVIKLPPQQDEARKLLKSCLDAPNKVLAFVFGHGEDAEVAADKLTLLLRYNAVLSDVIVVVVPRIDVLEAQQRDQWIGPGTLVTVLTFDRVVSARLDSKTGQSAWSLKSALLAALGGGAR